MSILASHHNVTWSAWLYKCNYKEQMLLARGIHIERRQVSCLYHLHPLIAYPAYLQSLSADSDIDEITSYSPQYKADR